MSADWKVGVLALTLGAWLGCSSDETPAVNVGELPVRTAAAKARLKQLSGEVKIKRAAGDDWITAAERMELFENDKVRTVSGASALLEFINGSTVNLGEDALIAIAETHPRPGQERTDVTVIKGRIDAELDDADRKSITVSTPSATVRAGREIVFQ